jgi:hypothetical protein
VAVWFLWLVAGFLLLVSRFVYMRVIYLVFLKEVASLKIALQYLV